MIENRRNLLKAGGKLGVLGVLAAAGIITPELALAAESRNENAFRAQSLEQALAALGANRPPRSTDISINAPEIAENGAQVAISIATTLPKVELIAILIEKNPHILAALFNIPEGTEASIQTNCKIAESSRVHVLVKSDGKFLMGSREVKVTLGGCSA
ncbi:MAG: thiosulfate oxidation carrier protein SoxY [Azovibrio sp.]